MEVKDIIKNRRKQLRLTLLDIAKACDVSEATVSRWESGDIGDMKRSRIAALAKVLHISPSIIVGTEEDEKMYSNSGIDYIRVPLYSNLCCGNGGFVDDNIIEYVPVPSKDLKPNHEYFCQIANGDSMVNAGIDSGDLLVFEKTSSISVGSIGCFCIDENIATCKKYTEKGSVIMLMPMNTNYEPIIIDPIIDNFKILGSLKLCVKRYD